MPPAPWLWFEPAKEAGYGFGSDCAGSCLIFVSLQFHQAIPRVQEVKIFLASGGTPNGQNNRLYGEKPGNNRGD
jgi:hypothetical protein